MEQISLSCNKFYISKAEFWWFLNLNRINYSNVELPQINSNQPRLAFVDSQKYWVAENKGTNESGQTVLYIYLQCFWLKYKGNG